jgi:hypothetical protein
MPYSKAESQLATDHVTLLSPPPAGPSTVRGKDRKRNAIAKHFEFATCVVRAEFLLRWQKIKTLLLRNTLYQLF